jgi:hypothetical protein
VIVTAHRDVDHGLFVEHCPSVVDTRNALGPHVPAHVVRL